MDAAELHDRVERIVRDEFGRVVAALARRFGDLDVAEEAGQEALVTAMERWPTDGIPPNPGAWLTTTAVRKAIDTLRREQHRGPKQQAAQALLSPTARITPGVADEYPDEGEDDGPVADDRLRLIFACCHPALAEPARVALTLRLLGGLTVPEIAAAFLVPERTMAQRITRAKAKIADARIPFRVPRDDDLPERLGGVLAVLFLGYNEAYLPHGPGQRVDLAAEVIRLTRQLVGLLPDEPEPRGLLALLLLSEARRPARFAADGVLVRLDEQDRTLWNRDLIAEGHALVRACLVQNRPGRYQLLAAINAVHTDAARASDTDWRQILVLYDQLLAVLDTPIVRLNRAVAVAEVAGPLPALVIVDALADRLDGYHAFHATRADLLRRLGRTAPALREYERAIETAGNPGEVAHLSGLRDSLGHPRRPNS
ncbi:MAG TPA: sigma factor-like helix-turn-helix DNA-binding protein [Micropruina sp.]|nr:sigma factor-like helix-turn-helix DNA-binding protein [Micropruina sp.]